jgi:hypothetical protein
MTNPPEIRADNKKVRAENGVKNHQKRSNYLQLDRISLVSNF